MTAIIVNVLPPSSLTFAVDKETEPRPVENEAQTFEQDKESEPKEIETLYVYMRE